MRKEHEERLNPNTPGLIVLYGATKRKFRPLDSEVVLLGRAPGCDIGLVSPEVAPVHCVIVRLATGWRIRDCSGRATRVNGRAILDEPLRNGDTVQVGSFSFEAQLPVSSLGTAGSAPVASEELERLQRSRRGLAELALNLRRRLREEAQDHSRELMELERQRADLELLERKLRKTHEEQLTRQAQLASEKQELARRAEELEAKARQLRQIEETLQHEAEEQIKLVEVDLVRMRVEQQREAERLTRWQQDLQTRQTELSAAGGQIEQLLHEEREQLERDRQQIQREREYLNHERQEVIQMRAELERLKEQLAEQTPAPSVASRETQLDATPGARLESARKLLRELAEKRQAVSGQKKIVRSRQVRPPAQPEH